MCLDSEMIVGLFLFWIVVPMLFVSGIILVVYKINQNRTTKLK